MPYVLGLPKALKAQGLKVELVPGWETRGDASFNPYGAVSHWTAGPKTGDRPSLKVVVNGRPGLSGPLANVFLTRAGVAIVVAAGRANHAGKGGWRGLTGNSSVFGTEAENSGGGEWTAAQRWAYPRINAAYVSLGAKPENVCGHNEWAPTRKIDIRDWPMPAMRSQVTALLSGARIQEDDDMTPDEYRQVFADILGEAAAGETAFGRAIRDRINTIVTPSVTVGVWNAGFGSGETRQTAGQRLALAAAGVDPAALAEQITAALPAPANAGGGSVSKTDVEQAIRNVLGSLDEEATK